MRTRTLAIILTLTSVACDPGSDSERDARDDDFMTGGKADDTGGIVEDSPEARAVLVIANTATAAHLSGPVGLAAETVDALLDFRAGTDGMQGTADDQKADTLAELDAVEFMGPIAFEKLVAYTKPTALRVNSVQLRDPHPFAKILFVCKDVSGNINDEVADALVKDENPKDGNLDLSVAAVFRPFDQTTIATFSEVGRADCQFPASSTKCWQTDPIVPAVALNQATGVCLDALPNTTGGYSPAITKTTGPCFTTESTTLTLPLDGITLVLEDARVGAKYAGNGTLAEGLIRGFVSEAQANSLILPEELPIVGGEPLSKLLAGGQGNCKSNKNDKDVGPNGVPGWYFYLNFTATTVTLAEDE
jgi:hypothetical protein